MKKRESTQQKVVHPLYNRTAELLDSGLSAGEVASRLKKAGLDAEAASTLITDVIVARGKAAREASGDLHGQLAREAAREQARRSGRKKMLWGGLACLAGALVTLISYVAARPGGQFVMAYGAIVFGAGWFLVGLYQYHFGD